MTCDPTRSAETDAVFVAFSAKERRATKTGNHGVLVVIMQMHCTAEQIGADRVLSECNI